MSLFLAACTSLPPDQDALEIITLPYADSSRSTRAMGGQPERAGRTLATRAWIGPSSGRDAGERPLLLLAHGVDGHPDKFDAFASHLALQGVLVVAPAFPLSNRDAGNGFLGIGDISEQPTDLRFVLDQVLLAHDDPDAPLWARFNPDKVAALGHSLGGATLLGLTRYGEGELRITAQAYLSPATFLTVSFGPGPRPEGPPTLLMHGLDDGTVSVTFSEQLYDSIDDPRWFLGIADAGHSDPIEDDSDPPLPSRDASQRAVLAWLDTAFEGSEALPERLAELRDEAHLVRP